MVSDVSKNGAHLRVQQLELDPVQGRLYKAIAWARTLEILNENPGALLNEYAQGGYIELVESLKEQLTRAKVMDLRSLLKTPLKDLYGVGIENGELKILFSALEQYSSKRGIQIEFKLPKYKKRPNDLKPIGVYLTQV